MKKFLSYLLMLILVASCLSIPAAANAEDWITLRVECFDRSVSGLSVESNLQHDYIQKNFGDPNHIKVELVPVSRWSETDILNTWLAGGTAPDICYTYDTALVQQYVNMGGLTPLNDLLAEYGPNVSEFLGQGVLEYGQFDENGTKVQYYIPARRINVAKLGLFIRKDWLDKLGLKLPTTEEEFHNCLIAFRDNAELLLGADAAKMVPFSISTDIGWRADLLNVSKVPEDVSDETLYVYGYDDRHLLYPNYKEGIRVLNQWYNEGLIWKDFALYTDASVEDDMMKSGFVGAFIHNWDYPYRNGEDSIQANLTRANGADAGFIAVDCFQNDAGITRKYLADRIDRKVFFPATNDEPLASLLYLNFISSEETIKFLQTGKEGVTYKMTDNGAYEMLNATGEWIMNSGMNIDHTITVNGLYLGDATAATKALSYPGVNPDFIITANTYGKLKSRTGTGASGSCGAISAEEDVGTSLNSKRDAMLTQAVVAPVDQFDSVYDKGMADYLASGGQNIIDERREKLEAIYGVHVD